MKLEFLIKYIEGSTNQGIIDDVEQWILQDIDNNLYLEKVKKVWFSSIDDLKALGSIDVKKDWEVIEKRLEQKLLSEESKRNAWLVWNNLFIKVAAVLIVGMLAASLFFYANRILIHKSQLASNRYEIIVPDGQTSNLVLPDGTRVMVNAGSKLFLPKEDESDKREVWLEGEAFFQVTKDPHLPFWVHTSDINIKVMGTTFNVRAYSNEKIVETTLVEGKVLLNTTKGKGQDVPLSPDHKAIFVKSMDADIGASLRREFEGNIKVRQILVSNKINPELTTSWTQGKLTFEDEFFDVIARRLEKYYGVKIHMTDESLKNLKYTGTIKNISLDQALRALQTTTHFNYTLKDQNVTITK